ncbi:MAG: hypothetical protein LUC86_08170, partial [Prevotellaceae bacterium]|nr:hypothetical protein [Prevotellaceae bacterium]
IMGGGRKPCAKVSIFSGFVLHKPFDSEPVAVGLGDNARTSVPLSSFVKSSRLCLGGGTKRPAKRKSGGTLINPSFPSDSFLTNKGDSQEKNVVSPTPQPVRGDYMHEGLDKSVRRYAALFALFFLLCQFSFAQTGMVRVNCKDGTFIVGQLKQMDVTSSVIISVAGIDTSIPMENVQSVEPYGTEAKGAASASDDKMPMAAVPVVGPLSNRYADYSIIDTSTKYPEMFTVEVGGQQLTMVLVRGGVFNMGYDDWKSRQMKSEPVHQVELSSFYVSDDFVNLSAANEVLASARDSLNGVDAGAKYTCCWQAAKALVDAIASGQNAPYRLVTESEWEYAAILPVQTVVFRKTQNYTQLSRPVERNYYDYDDNVNGSRRRQKVLAEWCYDAYDDYREVWTKNPMGPNLPSNKPHAARIYDFSSNQKWKRLKMGEDKECFVRLAISADQVSNLNR